METCTQNYYNTQLFIMYYKFVTLSHEINKMHVEKCTFVFTHYSKVSTMNVSNQY